MPGRFNSLDTKSEEAGKEEASFFAHARLESPENNFLALIAASSSFSANIHNTKVEQIKKPVFCNSICHIAGDHVTVLRLSSVIKAFFSLIRLRSPGLRAQPVRAPTVQISKLKRQIDLKPKTRFYRYTSERLRYPGRSGDPRKR